MSLRFSKITRAVVRKLAPLEAITEHGIKVERLKDGDIRYSVNIMVDGERIHRIIGRESDGTTRTQAEEFIVRTRSAAKAGRLSLPKGRKTTLNFGQAAAIYMTRLTEAGGKNMAEKERHFRLHLVPALGKLPLNKFSTFTLEVYRKKTIARGVSESTVNLHMATYRHMGRKLLEWGLINRPLPTIKIRKLDNRRDRILSASEKERLLHTAKEDSNPQIWLFVHVAIDTSLRHQEILSLRFENFDPERRRISVEVKGGRWREQPLTRRISRIFRDVQSTRGNDDGWVFPSLKTKSGRVDSMKSPFRRIVAAAGMDPKAVTPHVLRHTAITEIVETGANDRTVQAFSGHLSKEMVWRYTHRREKVVDEALDTFEANSTFGEQDSGSKRRCS